LSRSGIVFVLTTVLANTGFCQQTVKTADADCAKCHADIYRQYLATPMANASGPAVDHLFAGDFTHAPSGVRYKVFREQNQAWLSFNDVHDPRIAGKRRFDYFLGSGHLCTRKKATCSSHRWHGTRQLPAMT
jgi:hypothetical protein